MTPASMLPSSENLYTSANPAPPQFTPRKSLSSFNSADSAHNNPDAFTNYSAKRSISLVGPPPPINLLSGRIRKLSKPNISVSEAKMNASQNGALPQIRLAVKYQSIDVLPLQCYDGLRKVIVFPLCAMASGKGLTDYAF